MSEGFKGKFNRYTCGTCGRSIITVDADDGTTPFMIDCHATKGCGGEMRSSFYPDDIADPASHQWRKPTFKEFRKARPAMQQHYEMGGLGLWPIASQANRGVAK